MKVKAVISFGGEISMTKGQIKDIKNEAILYDLLKAGYVVAVEEEKPKKAVKKK